MTQRPGLVRCFPFGLYIGMMVLDPLLQPLLPAGLDGRWVYGLRVAVVTAALALFWRQYRELDEGPAPGWLAGATLVVPVMEEIFWRSFLLRWLQHPRFQSVDPTGVGLKALVISSVLFGTEHNLWFAGILAGLAYGWLYKRSGNLWVPVLAHAVTNASLGAYVLITGSRGLVVIGTPRDNPWPVAGISLKKAFGGEGHPERRIRQ